MKNSFSHPWIGFGVAAAIALLADGCSSPDSSSAGGGTARVEFVNPEKYTDLQANDRTLADSRTVLLPKIESYITDQAVRLLPSGRHLDVRILNIDEAGSIRLISGRQIRVAPDSEPARIELEYTLTDSTGKTLKSGRENLNSFGRPPNPSEQRSEELHLEKDLLRRWIRRMAS
jgi:hypothetical protein